MKWEHVLLGTKGEPCTRPGVTPKQERLNKAGISGKFLHSGTMPVADPPSKSVQADLQSTMGNIPTRQWDLAQSMTSLTHIHWGTSMHWARCQTWEKGTGTPKQAMAMPCVEWSYRSPVVVVGKNRLILEEPGTASQRWCLYTWFWAYHIGFLVAKKQTTTNTTHTHTPKTNKQKNPGNAFLYF